MAMPKTALEGIRVIDLGRYQAGPRIGSAPVPGEHTEEILTSVLNYTQEEIAKLEAEGAVYRGAR